MGEAKRRKRYLETLATAPVPDSGLFLMSRRDGVSVVLAAKPAEGGKVDAALFCVDEWQEGLFQCLGRRYDSSAPFQEALRAHGAAFRASTPQECRVRVAWGRAIRRRARAVPPPGAARWEFLLAPMAEPAEAEIVYGCPECGSPLPEGLQETIREAMAGQTACYMVCEECIRTDGRRLSAEESHLPHRRRMDAFLDAEEFSLDPCDDSGRWMMAMPGDAQRGAIALSLQEGDPVRTAAFALETWIIRAARPNSQIKDEHILKALETLAVSRGSGAPLPDEASEEADWVRRAAQEGLAAFASACAEILDAAGRERAAAGGILKVIDDVRRRRSVLRPRKYIDFVSPHIK